MITTLIPLIVFLLAAVPVSFVLLTLTLATFTVDAPDLRERPKP